MAEAEASAADMAAVVDTAEAEASAVDMAAVAADMVAEAMAADMVDTAVTAIRIKAELVMDMVDSQVDSVLTAGGGRVGVYTQATRAIAAMLQVTLTGATTNRKLCTLAKTNQMFKVVSS